VELRALKGRPVRLPGARWRAEYPALAVLVGVACAHVLILVLGKYTYFAAPDNSEQFWPWYQKAAASLHSGQLPLWDSNTLGGHSFVGETQTGVFYPLNLMWLGVFGGSSGIGPRRLDGLVVVHLLIASTGFYALARSYRLQWIPAVVAAVVFAYTGPVFARTTGQTAIFFGLALIPWAVFFARRQLETGRLRFGVAAGACLGAGLLAGHFQPPFHAALIIGIIYLLRRWPAGAARRPALIARAKGLMTIGAAATIAALPQLVYSLPYLYRAYRFTGEPNPTPPGGKVSYETFSAAFSGGPDTALTFLDPRRFPALDGNELFIGLAALAVLLLAGVRWRAEIRTRLDGDGLALAVVAAFGVVAIIGPWTFVPRVLYELPFFAQVRELGRYAVMVHLVLCLVLACALQALADDRDLRTPGRVRGVRLAAVVAGAFAALNGVYLAVDPAPGDTGWFGVQLGLAGLAVLALAVPPRRLRVSLVVLVGLLVVAGSLQNGARMLGRTSSPLYPPRDYARTTAITYVERACAGHRTLVLDDAFPRNVADVYRRIRTQNGFGATLHVPYFDFISRASYTDPVQLALLDMRCIVAKKPQSVPGYRVGHVDAARGVTVYIDERTSGLNTTAGVPVPAQILRIEDRRLTYRVILQRPTTLVLSALVYPGWKLRVDGSTVKTGSYDVGDERVFPEVRVSSGRHTIDYSWSGLPG
jgi:hypothetical protein